MLHSTNSSAISENGKGRVSLNPLFARPGEAQDVPKYHFPRSEMLPRTAKQIVSDEIMLDGNARLNLATFCTTWMEPEATELMASAFDKNMIDKDEYPYTAEIENRCVNMLADLWHAPSDKGEATGCSTTGSSEACMLGGMALKWRWKKKREAAGKPTDKPNMVMGIDVQVCWEKFARYWEVEPRFVKMEGDRRVLTGEEAVKLCDENTIGVVGIFGTTFDGTYENIADIARALDDLQDEKGWDIPIHVDGASGGMIAPFLDPELAWDFRIDRVASINTSGHKFGMVYPGVGWVVWRNKDALPEELIFYVNYLGGEMPTFALNFSRPGNQIIAQYYNFLRLGYDGYRRCQQECRDVATYLSGKVAEMGPFELLTDGSDIPVFCFKLKDEVKNFTLYDLSERLRDRGWQVPAYSLPENLTDTVVMRYVIRNGTSRDVANMVLADMERHLDYFSKLKTPTPAVSGASFHH